jgi:hypothetical protein
MVMRIAVRLQESEQSGIVGAEEWYDDIPRGGEERIENHDD